MDVRVHLCARRCVCTWASGVCVCIYLASGVCVCVPGPGGGVGVCMRGHRGRACSYDIVCMCTFAAIRIFGNKYTHMPKSPYVAASVLSRSSSLKPVMIVMMRHDATEVV